MEYAAGLMKLKPGSEDVLASWQSTMASRVAEVRASMESEGVSVESWFKLELAGQTYLMWYMRAESMQKAVEAFQKSTASIDQFHFESLTAIVEPDGHSFAQPLLDFSVSE